MKKIISIVLALAMVFTLGICAFAEGEVATTGSITVENPIPGAIYQAYKIFDLEKLGASANAGEGVDDGYLYTISADPASPWYGFVSTYASTEGNGLTLESYAEGKEIVVRDNSFDATKFAAAIKANGIPTGVTGLSFVGNADGDMVADDLDLGYYFVTSSIGIVAGLTTAEPDATVEEKNTFNVDKTEDETSFDIGDDVTYTVTSTIPDTTGITDYNYTFKDTMTNGLDFNNDVVVKIGETVVTPDDNYVVNYYDTNTHYFEIVFDIDNNFFQGHKGETLTIEYSAKLNANAAGVVSDNEITLEYGNNGSFTDDVIVYTFNIEVTKVEKGTTTTLPGAQFKLYKMDGTDKVYYKNNNGTIEWVPESDAQVFTTGSDGKIHDIIGLKYGEYFLQETKAPSGYASLKEDVKVELNQIEDITVQTHGVKVDGSYSENQYFDETAAAATTVNLKGEATVENAKAGTELPSTGGIGTTIFYIVGSILVVGAAIFLIVRRRMGAAEA